MIYKEFNTIRQLNEFLKDYSVKDCIINIDPNNQYCVWINYILVECPHCHKKTPNNEKYCALCGENF
jgi:hypothetical protein